MAQCPKPFPSKPKWAFAPVARAQPTSPPPQPLSREPSTRLKNSACLFGLLMVLGRADVWPRYLAHWIQTKLRPRWAVRSLGFNAPNPLIRPPVNGLSAPIPTIAEAEKDVRRTKVDLGPRALSGELQKNLATQLDARPLNLGASTRPEDCPLNLDAPIPRRVRLGENTHFPVAFASRGGAKGE